jgi:hypothetical protein
MQCEQERPRPDTPRAEAGSSALVDNRIIALARQLCAIVDRIGPRYGSPHPQLAIEDAHRAKVIVNNLRPLLDQCEKQETA